MSDPLEFTAEVRFREVTATSDSDRRFQLVQSNGNVVFYRYSEGTLASMGVAVPPPMPPTYRIELRHHFDLTEDELVGWANNLGGAYAEVARAKLDELGIDWRAES